MHSEQFQPFLAIPGKMKFNTDFASMAPVDYVRKEDPIRGILTRKRKPSRINELPRAESLLTQGAMTISTNGDLQGPENVLVDGTKAPQEEDEEMKSITPSQLAEYESAHPIKKKTTIPGHNLKKQIFRQLEQA